MSPSDISDMSLGHFFALVASNRKKRSVAGSLAEWKKEAADKLAKMGLLEEYKASNKKLTVDELDTLWERWTARAKQTRKPIRRRSSKYPKGSVQP